MTQRHYNAGNMVVTNLFTGEVYGGDGDRCGVCLDRWPCRKSVEDADEVCDCGHIRMTHIYYEGACRPGWVCDCSEFVTAKGAKR